MTKAKRLERVVALALELVSRPTHLFSFGKFCDQFDVAKSTLSEDVQAIKNGVALFGLGEVETVAGAAGGVRFVPVCKQAEEKAFLLALAERLMEPERVIPGGFLYMSDLLFEPYIVSRLGEIFRRHFADCRPDYILTVETKGIPLALMTARAFDVPLVMARRGSRVTEGSAVSINYVTGSARRIETMSLPRRALPTGARVLIIDDFMKAGGSAKGLCDLASEVGAKVVGTGVLITTCEPEEKMLSDYLTLLELDLLNEQSRMTRIHPVDCSE